MELGATVCHPRQPDCGNCPVARSCVARRQQTVDLIPAKVGPPKLIKKEIEVYVVIRNTRILLQQRPEDFPNAGFWELPNNETGPKKQLPKCARPLGSANHNITKYRITLKAYAIKSAKFEGRWCTFSDLSKYPVTSAHRKILKYVDLPARQTTE